jgi:hypothetical protein
MGGPHASKIFIVIALSFPTTAGKIPAPGSESIPFFHGNRWQRRKNTTTTHSFA